MTIKISQGTISVIHSQAPDNWQQRLNQSLTDTQQGLCLWSHEKYTPSLALSHSTKNVDLVIHGHTNSEQIICKKQSCLEHHAP